MLNAEAMPTRGGYKRYIVPGPGKMKKHSQFFCNKAQNYWSKAVASITINLFVDLSMTADSDYYINNLC